MEYGQVIEPSKNIEHVTAIRFQRSETILWISYFFREIHTRRHNYIEPNLWIAKNWYNL